MRGVVARFFLPPRRVGFQGPARPRLHNLQRSWRCQETIHWCLVGSLRYLWRQSEHEDLQHSWRHATPHLCWPVGRVGHSDGRPKANVNHFTKLGVYEVALPRSDGGHFLIDLCEFDHDPRKDPPLSEYVVSDHDPFCVALLSEEATAPECMPMFEKDGYCLLHLEVGNVSS